MPDHDADFTAFARRGCADAFRRLVARHVDAVHSAARRLMDGREDAAADVAQAVFIQLARKVSVLPEDLVVGSWLHRQTVRLALNARRAEGRRRAREYTAHEMLTMNEDESEIHAAALRPFIDQAIHALPALDQRVIVMHYFDRCQQREIAQRLGMSAGAVQKRISRALERLRKHLARHGVAVPAAMLVSWLGSSSVEAAPATLARAIAAHSLPHAATGAGFISQLITIMTHTKALTAGALLGMAAGGFWAVWPAQAATASVSPSAQVTGKPNTSPLTTRGVKNDALSPGPAPQPADTAEGLVAQLLEFALLPDTEITRQRMAAWMAGIPANLWAAFVSAAHGQLEEDEKGRLLPELARAWARIDPVAALTGIASIKGLSHPTSNESAGRVCLCHLARHGSAGRTELDDRTSGGSRFRQSVAGICHHHRRIAHDEI